MNILVTGGAGYIGSHTVIELKRYGFNPIIFDNFSNSSKQTLKKIKKITGDNLEFFLGDIKNCSDLESVFNTKKISAVIHFAGVKSTSESIQNPIKYYQENVLGSIQLLKAMSKHGVKKIIFSSSAAVYGKPVTLPIGEHTQDLVPCNPYGMSKLFIENILRDIFNSDTSWSIVNLRYFNPIGAHKSGEIGESLAHNPSNLMPVIVQTALGKQKFLKIYGDDYETSDGTGVRDYIHIADLANGHIKALEKILNEGEIHAINLGTGRGYSVMEVINTFRIVSGIDIPYKIVKRRLGDVDSCYACADLAKQELGWEAKMDLEAMCADAWNWHTKNLDSFS